MRRTVPCFYRASSVRHASSTTSARPPIIKINGGTFYRRQPATPGSGEESPSNRPIFPDLKFQFPTDNDLNQYWAIVGPSNAGKTTFLEILRGQHLCYPPNARSYPYLSTDEIAAKDLRLRYSGNAIQYVGFNSKERGLSGLGSYMSARYESRREATDFTLLHFLKGETELNPDKNVQAFKETALLDRVLRDLRLGDLASMPVSNLSNGQTRRARIAKALLGRPEILLLDEPFMGLDPPTTIHLSTLLQKMAASSNPRLLLSLRPQDPIPEWITHLLFLGEDLRVTQQGSKEEVRMALENEADTLRHGPKEDLEKIPRSYNEFGRSLTEEGSIRDPSTLSDSARKTFDSARRRYQEGNRADWVLKHLNQDGKRVGRGGNNEFFGNEPPIGEPIVDMQGVVVKYGEKAVLGGWTQDIHGETKSQEGLYWTVRRGQRWGVFGPNGSGKTTLISLITSDHPQTYSLPVKVFGRSRLPSPGVPGISLFELQRRVGHSSPEVHAFFPRSLSVRATLESAYADTPAARPRLDVNADRRVDAFLRWFQGELNPAMGMNKELKEELLRRGPQEAREFSNPGNPEKWRENHNAWWFEHDTEQTKSIEWADDMIFGELPFSGQRLALFLRAIIASPDIVILDEAFSGFDDYVRDKCLLFLETGEMKRLTPYDKGYNLVPSGMLIRARNKRYTTDAVFSGLDDAQAIICVSHVKEEVPSCVRDWIYLPEAGAGEPCRVGKVGSRPIRADRQMWADVWGM